MSLSAFYFSIKWLHVALAFTSLGFFLVRAVWSIRGSNRLSTKWVKVSPHIIDTFLLAAGVTLVTMSGQFPVPRPWLTAKLLALCTYILLGTMAIKRARTAGSRAVFALLALLTFVYMLWVAFTKNPAPFLGY